ncbi:hypothetical protein [Intestinicryptomonas porci]|uniref:Uncharacterized protein n=1 Tax=Intestinicryptomonas porci TaxID=2926320 RepID=A0ABU4WG64_9BACT|nr:hypothetical protein [Opitutales bacterium CLA-KB-P66]
MQEKETFAWILILLTMLALSLIPNLYYILKGKEEFYSDYRNEIDISREDFNRRYMTKRIIWAIIPLLILGLMGLINLYR